MLHPMKTSLRKGFTLIELVTMHGRVANNARYLAGFQAPKSRKVRFPLAIF